MSTEKQPIPAPYFVDIETVPMCEHFPKNTLLGELFLKRFRFEYEKTLGMINPAEVVSQDMPGEIAEEELWKNKASVYAEFGKIVCISIGKVVFGKDTIDPELHIKTLFDTDEQKLLIQFRDMLNKTKDPDTIRLCAHNGKEFDFPWLFRRMVVNKVTIPSVLNISTQKTYEYRMDDTADLWSHTQWKHKMGLGLICEILGIEYPKSDMDGSMVAEVYYSIFKEDKSELPFDKEERVKAAIKRITDYCPKDVYALANIFCRLKGFNMIPPQQVRLWS